MNGIELFEKCKKDFGLVIPVKFHRTSLPTSCLFDKDATAIIIYFENGVVVQYELNETTGIWKDYILKTRDEDNPYLDILNMTNKEAANIIRGLLINAIVGRGNGKSITSLKCNTALNKAVKCLEDTPDTATDKVKQQHRGLRASMSILDDYAGSDVHKSLIGFGKAVPLTEKEKEHYDKYINIFKPKDDKPVQDPHWVETALQKMREDSKFQDRFLIGWDLAPTDDDFTKNPDGFLAKYERYMPDSLSPSKVELIDDTSLHRSMNESHADYCKRVAKILGMNADITEQEAIEKVDKFFNSFARTNPMSPIDLQTALKKKKDMQNTLNQPRKRKKR